MKKALVIDIINIVSLDIFKGKGYKMKIFLIIFALALIASSCGFRKYVWFISLGYGAAIALIGVGLLFIFPSELTLVTTLQCVLLRARSKLMMVFLLAQKWGSGYPRHFYTLSRLHR